MIHIHLDMSIIKLSDVMNNMEYCVSDENEKRMNPIHIWMIHVEVGEVDAFRS